MAVDISQGGLKWVASIDLSQIKVDAKTLDQILKELGQTGIDSSKIDALFKKHHEVTQELEAQRKAQIQAANEQIAALEKVYEEKRKIRLDDAQAQLDALKNIREQIAAEKAAIEEIKNNKSKATKQSENEAKAALKEVIDSAKQIVNGTGNPSVEIISAIVPSEMIKQKEVELKEFFDFTRKQRESMIPLLQDGTLKENQAAPRYDLQKPKQSITNILSGDSVQVIENTKAIYAELDETTKQYINTLVQLQMELTELYGAQTELDKAYENNSISQSEYTSKTESLTAQILANKAVIKDLNNTQKEYLNINNAASGSIDQLESKLKSLVNQYAALTQEERESSNGQSMDQEIKDLQAAINDLDPTKITKVKGAMAELRQLKQQLASGNLSGEDLEKASQRATELQRNLSNVNKQLKLQSSNTSGVDALSDGVQALVGGFTALQGIVGVFTDDESKLQAVTAGAASAMALLNGVQQVAQTLNKNSDLNNYINSLQLRKKSTDANTLSQTANNTETIVNTEATEANAIAQNTQSAATKGATASMWSLNAAMDANPVGVLLIAITAIVGALNYFIDNGEKAAAVQEKLNDAMERAQKIQLELASMYNTSFDENIRKANVELELAQARGASAQTLINLQTKLNALTAKSQLHGLDNLAMTSQGSILKPSNDIEGYIKQYNELGKTVENLQAKLLSATNSYGTMNKSSAADHYIKNIESQLSRAQSSYNSVKVYIDGYNNAMSKDAVDNAAYQKKLSDDADRESKKRAALNKQELENLQEFSKKKKAIYDDIAKLDKEYSNKNISQTEQEIAAVLDRVNSIKKNITDFNNDPKNKNVRINVADTNSLLSNVQDKGIQSIADKQDLEDFKAELNARKDLFTKYYSWIDTAGKKAADVQFGDETSGFKTLEENLQAMSTDIIKAAEKDPQNKNGAKWTSYYQPMIEAVQLMLDDLKKDTDNKTDEIIRGLIIKSESFQDKIQAIKDKYNAERNTLTDQNKLTPELDNSLNKAQGQDIDAANDEFLQKDKQYQRLLELANIYSVDELKIRVDRAKKAIEIDSSLSESEKANALKSIKDMEGVISQMPISSDREGSLSQFLFGDSYFNYKTKVEQAKQSLEAYIAAQSRLKENGISSGNEWDKIQDGIKRSTNEVNQLGEGIKKAQAQAADIGYFASQVSGMASSLSNAFRGTNDDLADTFESISDIAGAVSNIAQGFSQGGVVGGAIATVTSVASIWGKAKQATAAAKKEVQDYYNAIAEGEATLSKNAYDTSIAAAQKIANSASSVKTQLDLSYKQQSDVQGKVTDLLKKLQGEDYISDVVLKKKGLFGIGGKKAVDIMSSLNGKSVDDILDLLEKGQLKDQAKEDAELLKTYNDELKQLGLTIDDLKEQWKEVWTGTDLSSLSDEISDLFANGTTSAQDFADSFQSIMKNAIMATFKQKYLTDALQPWYDELAEYSSDGLNTQEVAALKSSYDSIMQGGVDFMTNLQKVTGIDLSSIGNSSNNLSGAIQRSLTEATGDELAGLYRNNNDLIRQQTNTLRQQLSIATQNLQSVQRIEINTAETVNQLKTYLPNLIDIKDNTRGSLKTARDIFGKL